MSQAGVHAPRCGFTLLEVLLSVAIIGLLLAASVPLNLSLFYQNDLDVATNQIAQSLGRAASLSRAADGDTTWGVKVQTGSEVVFKGSSFAARDTAYDESYPLASSIAVSGTTEYVFAKGSGLPQATGSLTLTAANNNTKTITINSAGMVQY